MIQYHWNVRLYLGTRHTATSQLNHVIYRRSAAQNIHTQGDQLSRKPKLTVFPCGNGLLYVSSSMANCKVNPTRSYQIPLAALHGSQVGLIWMAIARDAETNSVTEQVMVGKIWQNHLAMENPQF